MRAALSIIFRPLVLSVPLVLFVLLIAAPRSAPAQDSEVPSRYIDDTFRFDARGDAQIEITFQYGARQWEQWREQYGDHPDLLLRDLRYQLASSDIQNFTLDKDDIQRRAVARFAAFGLARYNGGGAFVVDVPKEMKLVNGSGSDWSFTSSKFVNGELLNETAHAKLPPEAQNPQFSEGGDFNQITYTVNQPPARPKGWLEAGISCLAAGILLGVVAVLGKRRA